MKKIIAFLSCLVVLYSCKKKPELLPIQEPPQVPPEMNFINLEDTAVRFNRAIILDIDNDGTKDIYFTTLLVGDPVLQQDKMQWLVTGAFDTNFPVDASESIPVLRLNDAITVNNMPGYKWYNASSILLAQKILSITLPPYWSGDWKDANHRYVPFQLIKVAGIYNGWVEIGFDAQNEKLVLYKAAVCKEMNKNIRAGK